MNRKEMLAELREVIGDTEQPYLWSDLRLIRWLAEGEDRFCEHTGFFLDIDTYMITTEDGVKDYPYSDRIIQINHVWDGERRLHLFTQRQRPSREVFTQTPPRPEYYQTDRTTNKLSLYTPPVAGIVLTLEVWRRPKVSLLTSTQPEIPSQFHLAPVEWAANKAYSDHDSEKTDVKKAVDHRVLFEDYVSEGKRAFVRQHRHSPQVAPSPYYVV